MASFNLNSINTALSAPKNENNGVNFSGKSIKLDTENDAEPIIKAINECPELYFLELTGNTLGVSAANAIAKALEKHPELKIARWSDMFTGRMKTEIPPALAALGDGMIAAGTRLTLLDLSDNAFGPIGVEGLAKLLQSKVCSQLEELRLNNNGLGVTGAKLLANSLIDNPPRLRVFIAGRNRLENEGAKALAKVFSKMGSLEEVAMPQNGIYHVGVAALADAFRNNRQLRVLNLNDNTVGQKGAVAIVHVLPNLKCLKEMNFGDCLLKSSGALTLVNGLKDNKISLEALDVSCNEIGRVACMEIVDTVLALSRNGSLKRLCLAGNSLGGVNKKQEMKMKLGSAAELSDGEASDEEYVTGSEESDSDDDEVADESKSTESAGSDADHTADSTRVEDTVLVLDHSGVEEVQSEVERFLQQPTSQNLRELGDRCVDVIDVHLQVIKDPSAMIQAYVEATLKLSGLSDTDKQAEKAALSLYPILIKRAGERHAAQWLLANTMLQGFGLIKSENKQHKITWSLPGCYRILAAVIDTVLPASLRETLLFFIRSKRETLEAYKLNMNDYPTLIV